MDTLIAGAASGLMMASVFVCAGVLMLFPVVQDPPPGFRAFMQKLPPGTLVLSVVFLAYPVWGILGAVMAVVYEISNEQAPGSGLGSPNLVYTLAVVAAAVMLGIPIAILLRRVVAGVLAIAVAFMGLFGWFLPHFAS